MSNLISGLLIGGFFTYCYFSKHPDKAKKLATDVSWYVVSGYHKVSMWYGDTFVRKEDDEENIKIKKREIEMIKFHGYSNGNIVVRDINVEKVKYLVENHEVCFVGKEIGNKLYYKRFENVNDDFDEKEKSEEESGDEKSEKESGDEEKESGDEEKESGDEEKESGDEEKESGDEEKESGDEEKESGDEEKESGDEEKESGDEERIQDTIEEIEAEESMVPCVRHFLQVECVMGKEKYDIHEHISKYYITNNMIMDEIFMRYFMKHWYDVELDEDYKLKIIDKNVNLLTLEKNQKILLGKDDYIKLKTNIL